MLKNKLLLIMTTTLFVGCSSAQEKACREEAEACPAPGFEFGAQDIAGRGLPDNAATTRPGPGQFALTRPAYRSEKQPLFRSL